MNRIKFSSTKSFAPLLEKWDAESIKIFSNSSLTEPKFISWKGRDEVIKTSLQNEDRPVMIVGNANIPEGKRSFLILNVSCEDDGEWELEITIEPAFVLDPEFFGKEIVNSISITNGWKEIKFDLTKYSGNDVEFQIIQSADEIHKSHAYWSNIKIVYE